MLTDNKAIEFVRPLKSTPPLEAVHALVRSVAKPWDHDRFMQPDMEAVVDLVKSGKVAEVVRPFLKEEGT
jgi:histidine ammonia-lyase